MSVSKRLLEMKPSKKRDELAENLGIYIPGKKEKKTKEKKTKEKQTKLDI